LTSSDTLDFLINLRDSEPERLNDDQLLGLINNFFNAGNSSRATIISWTIFLLSQHPHYLQETEAELARTLNGRPPEINELERLPLLRGALQESMRLLPPMNWFPRRTSAPAQLGPYAIPAGSMVICSPFITHRLPEIFPHPDRFMPGRWTAKLSPYDYMPFGAGPRICPGRDLAMLEMMTVLAMILQRYRLAPPPHARIDRAGMMLSAPRRMPVVVQRPDGPYAARPCRGNINRWIDFGRREEK
jgi:cytochrome P450